MSVDPETVGPVVADHYTSTVSAIGLGLASVAVVFGQFLLAAVPLAALLVALAFATRIRRTLDPDLASADPERARALEELRLLYANGEIGDEEYERRYDAIVEDGPEAESPAEDGPEAAWSGDGDPEGE